MVGKRPVGSDLEIGGNSVDLVGIFADVAAEKLAAEFAVFIIIFVAAVCGKLAAKVYSRLFFKCGKRFGMKIGSCSPAIAVDPNAKAVSCLRLC